MDDQLVEQLVIVKIDASSSYLPTEDRDPVGPTELDIDLLGQVLMISNADVRVRRREEDQGLATQARQGVIE